MNYNSHKVSNKKLSKYYSTHFNIKVCTTHKHTDLCLVSGILLIYQDVKIGYATLSAKIKFVRCKYFGNVKKFKHNSSYIAVDTGSWIGNWKIWLSENGL